MRILAMVLGAVVLVAASIGGTLGVQRVTSGESPACAEMNSTVGNVLVDYHKHPNSVVTKDEWDYLDKVLDVRYKVCHQ